MGEDKTPIELTIMEAVDNLSSLADLDAIASEKEGAALAASDLAPGEETHGKQWLDPKYREQNKEVVKQTFRSLRNYLQRVYEKDKSHLHDVETQKGIHAIMVLAGEAAQKVDKYTNIFKGARDEKGLTHLQEYKELQQFYLTKIMKKFQQVLEKEEAWQVEWGNLEDDYFDIQRRGLKDLEMVRRDKDYELFYIQKEDGKPFFNRNLLRHIKLVGDFDETVSDPSGEDPFLRVKVIQDKEVNAAAKYIIQSSMRYLDEFYKEALRHKDKTIVSALNRAVMALMLAANPRNLMQNTIGKSCFNYYTDFHFYLRLALTSNEYRKFLIAQTKSSDYFYNATLNLVHALCSFFFLRQERRKEMVELIHRLIQKNQKTGGFAPHQWQSVSFWNHLLEEDEQIRKLLKRFPNGPLLKTLDSFREGYYQLGFDPIAQHNWPALLFSFGYDDVHTSCLRIPAPLRQAVINKAEVVVEFYGFLHALNLKMNGERHLLINLQDRTSWQEHARSLALEEMAKQEEFFKSLIVLTLPKNTDFYLQTAHYQQVNEAEAFIKQFKEQIASAEECGFYFPLIVSKKTIVEFSSKALALIHKLFFASKTTLTRKNRLDFIEIFYSVLTLAFVNWTKPDTMSFSCKDTIDIGAAMNVSFFAFLKMFSTDSAWTLPIKDFIQWMWYDPALQNRDRTIDLQRLSRSVSALAVMQAELDCERRELLKQFSQLYGRAIFEKMKIEI